jgi:hypothetical protein
MEALGRTGVGHGLRVGLYCKALIAATWMRI